MALVDELTIEATDKNLAIMQEFIESKLESMDCSMKEIMQIAVSAEEVFVNIAHYAYAPLNGQVTVRMEVIENPPHVDLTFIDSGTRYDPLANEDPDITLPIAQRKIGGLGIFIVKKMMDHARYEYRDGKNILTISKDLSS